jgi:hypothetical protein
MLGFLTDHMIKSCFKRILHMHFSFYITILFLARNFAAFQMLFFFSRNKSFGLNFKSKLSASVFQKLGNKYLFHGFSQKLQKLNFNIILNANQKHNSEFKTLSPVNSAFTIFTILFHANQVSLN